jgi:hypothetical protein
MPGIRTLLYVIQLALGIALPLAAQLWDRKQLTAEQRARVWNWASWGAALYAFGPASMLGWWWVTRRRPLALGVGAFMGVGMLLLITWMTEVAAKALGIPP